MDNTKILSNKIPSISNISIKDFMLIDSKVINSFSNILFFNIENLNFKLKLLNNPFKNPYISIKKKDDGYIFNFYHNNSDGGMFKPIHFGDIDGIKYYISFTAVHYTNNCRAITINLFQQACHKDNQA